LLLVELNPGFFAFADDHIDALAGALIRASRVKWVKGILLTINHSGGDLSQADRLWCIVAHVGQLKPTVTYIRAATSAGYCVASASKLLVANPCALIGGLGAVTVRADASLLLASLGICAFDVIAGDKPVGDWLEPATDREAELHVRRAQTGAELLYRRVMVGRRMERNTLREVADGTIFCADEGLHSNLVDQVGTLTDALDQLSSIVRQGDLPVARLDRSSVLAGGRWWSRIPGFQWLTSTLINTAYRS
jgi:protease IV